jgi:2-phosphoglycerate kinase
MALPAFDTLRVANRLKAVGVPSAQAEAEAEVLSEVFEVNLRELATKEDLRATKEDLRREIGDLRKDMDAKHESLRKDLFHEMRELESRLVIRLGRISAVGFGLIGTLLVVLKFFVH